VRDLLVAGLVAWLCLAALKRPWVGVMGWVWLSLMNPHRYCYGFAYDAPFAYLMALSIAGGVIFTRKLHSPMVGSPVTLMVMFCVWMTASWLMGLDPDGDYEQWFKVMKVMMMVLLLLAVLRTKQHIIALAWACALSLGILGAKGGAFTLASGGVHHVLGPAGSFIADNNEFALALVMTIPLLRFCHLQVKTVRMRQGLMVMMVLCAAAALGSQSRGGLLAILAMVALLWWRGGNRFLGGIVILAFGMLLLGFMPDEWTSRMESIGDYSDDKSSLNRISAWWTAWGVALHYPFGVGFELRRPELFMLYSPYPETGAWAAHSIYFQVMGNHGFIGLAIFLLIFLVTWIMAGRIRRMVAGQPELVWCAQLASMCQVALVGYLAGGAFLSLAYFDLQFYIVSLVALTHFWVKRRGWETETAASMAADAWPMRGLFGAPKA
jgi:putative inorganic carbon (HCO3(-)) transporter